MVALVVPVFFVYKDISYAAIYRVYSLILRYCVIGIYDKKGRKIGKIIFDEKTVNEVYEILLDEIAKRLCEVSTSTENLLYERF